MHYIKIYAPNEQSAIKLFKNKFNSNPSELIYSENGQRMSKKFVTHNNKIISDIVNFWNNNGCFVFPFLF